MRLFCCSRRHPIVSASLAVLFVIAVNVFSPAAAEGTVFMDCIIPAEEADAILQGLEETPEMPGLKLDGIPVIYDKTTNTCYYSSSGSGFTRAEVDLPDGRTTPDSRKSGHEFTD